MPRTSQRSRIEQVFTLLALANVDQSIAAAFNADDRGDSAAADDEFTYAAQTLQALDTVHHQRYLSTRSAVARLNVTIGERLAAYENDGDQQRYRQLVRMEPAAFHHIVSRLREHSIFNPNELEKHDSKQWVEDRCGVKKWRDGYASVDGVHIVCAWAPGLDGGDSFLNRKRRFSFNIQLVTLLHTLRIISYVVGHRGASSDARAWDCSAIVAAPRRHLHKDEWIWADLGYPYAPYLVSPYQHLAATKSVDFRRFNYNLSSIRIRSEHAMAYVKGRFPSLKGYRGLLATEEAEEFAQDFIVACLVAHNLAMKHDDAGKYLLYVKDGLEREMRGSDVDWNNANEDEEMERVAGENRERSHETWSIARQDEARE
ncbi:hypothetical protein A4X03_0g9307, partial [Tilletia caries]